MFFLQTRLKALGSDGNRAFGTVHVVGAGVMGGDIAALCAWRGMQVTLQDRNQAVVDAALGRAAILFGKLARGRSERAAAAQDRLRADVAGDGVPTADVVIEAIADDGTLRDTAVYSITAAEWPTVRKHLDFQLSRPH